MRLKYLVLITILVLVAVMPQPPLTQAQDGGDPYQQLRTRALSELGVNCANPQPNEACAGFAEFSAEFTDGATLENPGDRAALTTLKTLKTFGVDVTNSTWGIATLYVQANLPAAAPDTAVLLMLGDVEVTNNVTPEAAFVPGDPVAVTANTAAELRNGPASGAKLLGTVANGATLQADGVSGNGQWLRVLYEGQAAWVSLAAVNVPEGTNFQTVGLTPMQSFSFTTGGTTPPSLEIPPSVLIVQSPRDVPVQLFANGAELLVNGTLFLRTLPDGRTQLIVADGMTTAFPGDNDEVDVIAGTSIILPTGDSWTEWRILTDAEWESFGGVEYIPGNVIIIIIQLPDPERPSGIGEPPIIIIIPTGILVPYPPVLRTLWTVEVITGETGQPLERIDWLALDVGCAVCDDKVFYHSDKDGDFDIYLLADDGLSQPTNNVSQGNGSQDAMPSYSPDRQWVAWATNRDILGGWEIYVANADGSQPQRLTFNSGADHNAVWGPASLLAWESNRDGNWNLYMADTAGDGLPVQLTDDAANDINPFWFQTGGCDVPGDQQLVFQSDRDGDYELFLLNVATNELTQLTDNDVADVQPVVSPDGSQIAWLQENEDGVYDLMIMDVATLAGQKLAEVGTDIAGHVFSPAGDYVAFDADVDGDYDIYAVEVATGNLKAATNNDADDRAPTFMCDSTQIFYHSNIAETDETQGANEIFLVDLMPFDGPANFAEQQTNEPVANDFVPLS
ncbi:MAG: SH3 domain-containing protein, partial [Anaerolineae bacterium]|nr:SH3 domain-containing protein [Anaerolineae bacterium]